MPSRLVGGMRSLTNHIDILQAELKHLDAQLETNAQPQQLPQLYVQRGMVRFKLGDVAAAICDFDRAEALNPNLTPYLWQRGLAYYYVERYEEGAQQFEIDLTVNGQDAEETVWRYLCQAQLQGAQAAREALLPVRHDSRPVMGWVYKLFAGECEAEAVLAYPQGSSRRGTFYSQLYVGLYFEAEGSIDLARQYVTQAAELNLLDDYMGWLAIVHRRLRGW